MRKRCLETVYQLAKSNKDVVFVGSDLGVGVLDNFKKEMPDRFFMDGVSEQHLVGACAGLAMSGKIVYFNTIATFLTRRAFEQNMIDLGLTKAKVRILGSGGGLVYAPLGPTHLATEDIAMTVGAEFKTSVIYNNHRIAPALGDLRFYHANSLIQLPDGWEEVVKISQK